MVQEGSKETACHLGTSNVLRKIDADASANKFPLFKATWHILHVISIIIRVIFSRNIILVEKFTRKIKRLKANNNQKV